MGKMTDSDLQMLDPRTHAFRPDLADERLSSLVKAERYIPGDDAHVHRDSVPLFNEPSFDGELQTEALFGEIVRIFEIQDGWAWGQLQTDGYVGYLPLEALSPGVLKPTHCVRSLRTFVYEEANLKSPPIALISLMSPVAVAGEDGEFFELAINGYVFKNHLQSLVKQPLVDVDDRETKSTYAGIELDFVSAAERFIGTPYLWGGRTSLGLDCSALIQLALLSVGVFSRRDSDLQAATLGDVIIGAEAAGHDEISKLRRGDLVFWKGHIGVMVDEISLLHANAHHMAVAVEPLAPAVERIRANGGGEITVIRRYADYNFSA